MSCLIRNIKMEINKDLEDYVKKDVFNELWWKVNNINDRLWKIESIIDRIWRWFFWTMFVIVATLITTIAILINTIF
jgi:hypothetical protein